MTCNQAGCGLSVFISIKRKKDRTVVDGKKSQ